MPRHALDDAERLFLEMARLERMRAADQGVTEPLIWRVGTERGEEAVRLDVPGNEALMAEYAAGRRRRPTRLEIERGLDHQRAAEAEAHQERGEAGEADEEDEIDPPGWKEPREPGGDEANREFLYYDAQTGDVVEAPSAPDVRRWYRLVEDSAAAYKTFNEGEFPLIVDTQMSDEDFFDMARAERDALMGGLHWDQYGSPGALLLPEAEDLQRRMGWRRSSAVRRPVRLASASAAPVTVRGQPRLPTVVERPFAPVPAAQDPLMEGLKEPLFPIPGAQRFIPQSVTDVESLDRQLEPDRLRAGSWWPEAPKPNELLTPRTGEILNELERQERMDLPAPTEMAGLVPLGEYLRRLAG